MLGVILILIIVVIACAGRSVVPVEPTAPPEADDAVNRSAIAMLFVAALAIGLVMLFGTGLGTFYVGR